MTGVARVDPGLGPGAGSPSIRLRDAAGARHALVRGQAGPDSLTGCSRRRVSHRQPVGSTLRSVGDRGTTFVQSLERGLAVIRTFDRETPATPSEVAAATGLTRAAARRFLLTLAGLGYVRAEGRAFQLSPRVLELGRAYLSGLTLPDAALPHLRGLVGAVRESSSAAVLDGDRIVYVAHVSARRVLSVSVTVGSCDPAFATSLGRVLLAAQSDEWLDRFLETAVLSPLTARTVVDPERLRAELLKVRRQGWALVDQELEEGLRAVAAAGP